MRLRLLVVLSWLVWIPVLNVFGTAESVALRSLKPVVNILKGTTATVDLSVSVELQRGSTWARLGGFAIVAGSDGLLSVSLEYKEHAVCVSRTTGCTEIILPRKGVVFRGGGEVAAGDRLDLREISREALDRSGIVGMPLQMLLSFRPEPLIGALLNGPESISYGDLPGECIANYPDRGCRARIGPASLFAFTNKPPAEYRHVNVGRGEMERTVRRGLVRMAAIAGEKNQMPDIFDRVTTVPHGRLERTLVGRLLLLSGLPRETGLAHGTLLAPEVRRVVDSTLYVVGLTYSLESGKWFPAEMRDAWRRLEPFVPADQIEEIRGIAEGSGVSFEEVKLANFFPELFHCSGFAVSGAATQGGKLYHGRVLDYMTGVGLQGCAAVIVTKNPGRLAWANVGYAGFNGSVSGMNEKKIALGEMGGRGEGNWDGVPMGTLMRRALQDASSLDDAKRVFSESPRTCEYYYVFSDGNARSAVGVYALPEKIEFVEPGAAHERLPDPLRDCVLLSAGDRYKCLVDRTRKGYGAIDEKSAIALMDRGVAMSGSNLHNVLFVPEDLVFLVANAGTDSIAAAEPYIRYDLTEILRRMPDAADRP